MSKYHRTINDIASFIEKTTTFDRKDRLISADPDVFTTNPLNIAHGVAGVLRYYKYTNQKFDKKYVDWMNGLEINETTVPPGLYAGMAGMAWTLYDLGDEERAFELIDMSNSSSLNNICPDIYYGDAGRGLVNLYFYLKTNQCSYLEKAIGIADDLISISLYDKNTLYWKNIDGLVHYGYGRGASGISLFFLYLFMSTNDNKYVKYAKCSIEFDLINKIKIGSGYGWADNELRKKSNIVSPYFGSGSSGIGMVLIRFYHFLKEERYLTFAEKSAIFSSSKYTVNPGLLNGLTGLGEFMLDMYSFTKEMKYKTIAINQAESIELYLIKSEKGVVFPGDYLMRASCDYGTGSAGIGMFLHRLISDSSRDLTLDNLI